MSYDPNYRASLWADDAAACDQIRSILPIVDIIKLSQEEMPFAAGIDDVDTAIKVLRKEGVALIVITLGEGGAVVATGDQQRSVPAFPCDAVDTTGAGDAFFGGFLERICKERQERIRCKHRRYGTFRPCGLRHSQPLHRQARRNTRNAHYGRSNRAFKRIRRLHMPLTIEHHAVMFALLAKHAIEISGEKGKEAILAGMTRYGNERGRRMALNALERGDKLTVLNSQAYGEWKPDFPGQMEFGVTCGMPVLHTYIAKCAWCDAWAKHGLTEYGRVLLLQHRQRLVSGLQSGIHLHPAEPAHELGRRLLPVQLGRGADPQADKGAEQKEKVPGQCLHKGLYLSHRPHTAYRRRRAYGRAWQRRRYGC